MVVPVRLCASFCLKKQRVIWVTIYNIQQSYLIQFKYENLGGIIDYKVILSLFLYC